MKIKLRMVIVLAILIFFIGCCVGCIIYLRSTIEKQNIRILNQAEIIKESVLVVEAYNQLIIDHNELEINFSFVASISPLRNVMTPDEISTLLKEVPKGNIFFTRFIFSAPYGISIGYHGRPRTDHRGGDIHPEFPKNNEPMDMRVKPVADGVIEEFGENIVYGKFIIVRYSERVRTFYGHLDKIFYAGTTGRKVTKDTVIGLMGNTGMVFSDNGGGGKHVHHEVQVHNGDSWVSIDPEPFLINE